MSPRSPVPRRDCRLPTLRRAARGPRARAWRRVVLRRVASGLCASAVCWLVLGPYAERGGPPTAPGLVSTADLPVGHVLRADDLTTTRLPLAALPGSALAAPDQAVGRPLAAAVGRGELLTTSRVRTGGPLLPAGSRAVHVPLLDAPAAARCAAGDHIDLVAVADGEVVVADAVVIEVDRADTGAFGAAPAARGLTVAVPAHRVGPLTTAALGPRGGLHAAVRSS